MNLSLPQQTQKQIADRIKSGKYQSAEDVVAAAVSQLDQHEQVGDFQPGELDQLLAEGEQSGPPLDGEQVLAELKHLRDRSRAG